MLQKIKWVTSFRFLFSERLKPILLSKVDGILLLLKIFWDQPVEKHLELAYRPIQALLAQNLLKMIYLPD